ncbi:MAG: transposase [Candidatus Paracaedibacter sp.]
MTLFVSPPRHRFPVSIIKFKSPRGVQQTLSLMGKVRNIFAVDVGRYTKKASARRLAFAAACAIWSDAAQQILCV